MALARATRDWGVGAHYCYLAACGRKCLVGRPRRPTIGWSSWLSSRHWACHVVLYLDSEYVRKGITEWIAGWKSRGWRTASKQVVKNVDLWQRLDAAVFQAGHQIEWRWVKGHSGDPGNEHADMLANRGVDLARSLAGGA